MGSLLSRNVDITLATAIASCTTLDMRDVAHAAVVFGTLSTNVTSLQIWAGASAAGTFARVFKADGNAADLTITPSTANGQVCSLPDQVYAAQFLRLVAVHADAIHVPGVVMLKN